MSRAYLARCAFVFVAVLTGCSASFSVPEGTLVTCTSDAQCPSDLPVCAVTGLCVSRDLVGENGPTLIRATPASPTTILIEYDLQLLADSVTDVDAYRIEGLTVIAGALRADIVSVLLETSTQVPAFTYTLETPGVRDIAGRANTDAAVEFRGFGLLPDELAPDLVTPPHNAQIAEFTATLSWSGRSAALAYFIEISRSESFATLIMDPIEVAAPTTIRTVVFPSAGTYYWRVRSDIQPASAATTFHALHLFDDAIYVACPDGDASCVGGFGTRDQPLRDLSAAVALSGSTGIESIFVAARATPYAASLVVQTRITMVCGFDPAFTEPNAATPSIIQSINATGALFLSSVKSFNARGCNFRDGFGAAAVSIVGSTNVELQRVVIESAALDDVSALSLLDSTALIQDSILRMYLPQVSSQTRGDARDVAVVRANRSNLTLVDSEVRGATAIEPTGIDLNGSVASIEGVLVDTGNMPVNADDFGLAVGVRVATSTFSSYASRIRVGTGFQTVAGIRARGASIMTLNATRVENRGAIAGSRAIDIDGNVRAQIVNSVLSPGYTGITLQALEARVRAEGYVDTYHSLLLGAPNKPGPVITLSLLPNVPASCAPYEFAFVNNIIVAGGSGDNNIIVAGSSDDSAHNGTLFLNNALVTTNDAKCIANGDAITGDPSELGCAGQSLSNIFRNRSMQQFLGNLGGNDGNVDTLDDNDYRPDGPADRTALRAGQPTSGICAAQQCVNVTQDLNGAVRTSVPPTIGPFDFP